MNVGKVGVALLTAEFFWKLFESTGSIAAYLLYKQFLAYAI